MPTNICNNVARILAILVLSLTISCGSDDTTDNEGANNQQADAGVDAGIDDQSDGSAADVPPPEAEFQVGTNIVYENTPQSFTPIMDGAEVPLNFGVQGSWMVVLAFRTRNLIEGQFDIRADITIDGVESGDIWLEFQDTFPGGDGWDYYYNLFLAIDQNDPPARGTPATIHVSIEDLDGNAADRTHEVLIGEAVGGP